MTITLLNLDEATHDFRSPGRSTWTNERLAPPRPPACADPQSEIPGLEVAEQGVAEAQAKLDGHFAERTKLAARVAANEAERLAMRRRVAAGLPLDQPSVTRLSIEEHGLGDAESILAEAIEAATSELRQAEDRVRRVLLRYAQEVIRHLHFRAEAADAEVAAIQPRALSLRQWASEVHLGIGGPVPSAAQIRLALKID